MSSVVLECRKQIRRIDGRHTGVIFLELIVGEVAKVRLVALGKVMFQSGLVIETYRLVTFGVLSAPGKRTE